MNILVLGILAVFPGSWVTFGLPLEFNGKTRLAMAVALSPAILGIEYLAIKFVGIDFANAALILLAVNLPSGYFLMRRLHWSLRVSRTLIVASLLFSIFAGSLILLWLLIPGYRPFSWHALLHTDVIYEVTRSRLLPEEPEMAGLTLAYDWMGEIFWSVLGWLSNWSPTSMYPVTNLIWLLIAFVLAFELAKSGLGLHSSTALFGVGLLFLGNQIIVISTSVITNDIHHWEWILGTDQIAPLLAWYRGFEDMPFVFPLLLGLALVCLVGMRRRVRFLSAIIVSLMIAIGLIYPLFFPMACLLSGGTIFLLISRWARGLPRYEPRELFLLVAGFVVSVIVFLAFLTAITKDRANPSFQLLQAGRWSRGFQALTALLPLVLLAAPFVVKAILKRDGPTIVLTATGVFLVGLFLFTKVSYLEPKFIDASVIAVAPLSAAGVEQLFGRLTRMRWVLALMVPVALAIINFQYWFGLGAGTPSNLANAPQFSEDSFWIALAPSEKDMAWTSAVRASTPIDTIMVVLKPGIHLEPFIARSLYFPSDYDERSNIEYTVSPAGYSVDKRVYLLEQRGYSERVWDERLQVIKSFYDETDRTKSILVLQALQRLNRPLAIHFSSETVPALTWLRQEKIGSEFYSDSRNIIWFIERPVPVSAEFGR